MIAVRVQGARDFLMSELVREQSKADEDVADLFGVEVEDGCIRRVILAHGNGSYRELGGYDGRHAGGCNHMSPAAR